MHVSGCSFLLVYRAFKFLDQPTKIQNHNSDTYIYLHSIVRESPSKVGRWTLKILRGRLQLGVAIDDDSLICGTGRERERQRVKREKKCELEKIEGESGGRYAWLFVGEKELGLLGDNQ